jgi:SAM-dependent methyltransferase
MDGYRIKEGYAINAEPQLYEDTLEDSEFYQLPVYELAAGLAGRPGVRSVLDVGCGLATKLYRYLRPLCETVTGVDLPGTIACCRKLHPEGSWVAGDLEDPAFAVPGTYDLIVSADVIEHLRDPDRLLHVVGAASHRDTLVVISTPERDLRRGAGHMGPPGNGAHVREWNRAEFQDYVRSRGFAVEESRIVELSPGTMTCLVVVARPPSAPA